MSIIKKKDINLINEEKNVKIKEINEKIHLLFENFNIILNFDNKVSEIAYDQTHKLIYLIVREKQGTLLKCKLENLLFEYLKEKKEKNSKNNEFEYCSNLENIYNDFMTKSYLFKKLLFYYENNFILKNNYTEFIQFSKSIFQKVFFDSESNIYNLKLINEQIIIELNSILEEILFISEIKHKPNKNKSISILIKILIEVNPILFQTYYEDNILKIFYNEANQFILKLLNLYNLRISFKILKDIEIYYCKVLELLFDYSLSFSKNNINKILLIGLIKKLLFEEKDLVLSYLSDLTSKFVELSDCQFSLIIEEICFLYNFCLRSSIKEDRELYISTYFKLISKSIDIELKKVFNPHIKVNRDNFFKLLNFIINFEKLKKEICLINDSDFMSQIIYSLKNSFSDINSNYNNIIIELIISFIDDLLKIPSKHSEDYVIHNLSKVIIILKYIEDRDICEIRLRKSLSNRILNNKNFNEIYELSLISQLKDKFGNLFTNKLENMISDINSSKNLRDLIITKKFNFYNLDWKILTSCNWPLKELESQRIDVLHWKLKKFYIKEKNNDKNIRQIINNLLDFENYYKENYKGRILYINLFHGLMELNYKINKRNYYLNLSTIQGLICLCLLQKSYLPYVYLKFIIFNLPSLRNILDKKDILKENLNLSFSSNTVKPANLIKQSPQGGCELINKSLHEIIFSNQVQKEIQIQNNNLDLISHLIPLLNIGIVKLNIENNEKSYNDILEEDNNLSLILNNDFSYKSNNINLFIGKVVKEKEQKKNDDGGKLIIDEIILCNRKNQIDATIIRLMKQKKKMNYEDICYYVTDSLVNIFVPKKENIKERIENLTERKFLKRDEDAMNLFEYIA